MDRAAEEFNRASQALVIAQSRLMQIGAAVHSTERDIAMLTAIEANLLENIRVMKRKKLMIMITEFGKANRDLGLCRSKMAFLRMELDNHRKVYERTLAEFNKIKDIYDAAYNRLHNPPNNVIEFRKPDGQK